MFQAHAVQARIELDLRTGAAFTRFQTQLLQTIMATEGVVSYGSCQFPTLGFVVERYRKVRNFVPEPFWYIDLNVKVKDQSVGFTWSRGHLFDRMAVVVLYERCMDGSSTGLIKSVNEKPTSKWRPLPLTTVELQKQGARYLGLSSKKIMDIAEALYTSGYISYPRTETDQFDSAIDLKGLVGKQVDNTQWGQYAKR
jgi:DNA topoisomerase-3